MAANQLKVAKGLQDVFAVEVLARERDIPRKLPSLLTELLQAPRRLCQMSENAARITDGLGSIRVMEVMED